MYAIISETTNLGTGFTKLDPTGAYFQDLNEAKQFIDFLLPEHSTINVTTVPGRGWTLTATNPTCKKVFRIYETEQKKFHFGDEVYMVETKRNDEEPYIYTKWEFNSKCYACFTDPEEARKLAQWILKYHTAFIPDEPFCTVDVTHPDADSWTVTVLSKHPRIKNEVLTYRVIKGYENDTFYSYNDICNQA